MCHGTCYGLCDYDSRSIQYEQSLNGRSLLTIALHEMLHAEFPRAGEKSVTQAAIEIADALWKIGFRISNQIKIPALTK